MENKPLDYIYIEHVPCLEQKLAGLEAEIMRIKGGVNIVKYHLSDSQIPQLASAAILFIDGHFSWNEKNKIEDYLQRNFRTAYINRAEKLSGSTANVTLFQE